MNKRLLADASMRAVKALPNGATSTTSDAIDVGTSPIDGEVLIKAPALAVAALPDTKTMTYEIVGSANADLSSPTVLANVIVQTGAGGVGAVATENRWKMPSDVPRYIGVKATNSGAGNCSASSVTMQILF